VRAWRSASGRRGHCLDRLVCHLNRISDRDAVSLAPHILPTFFHVTPAAFPESQPFCRTRHQTTDKPRRGRPPELMRISAQLYPCRILICFGGIRPQGARADQTYVNRRQQSNGFWELRSHSAKCGRVACLLWVGCFLLARFRTDARLDPAAEKMLVAAIAAEGAEMHSISARRRSPWLAALIVWGAWAMLCLWPEDVLRRDELHPHPLPPTVFYSFLLSASLLRPINEQLILSEAVGWRAGIKTSFSTPRRSHVEAR